MPPPPQGRIATNAPYVSSSEDAAALVPEEELLPNAIARVVESSESSWSGGGTKAENDETPMGNFMPSLDARIEPVLGQARHMDPPDPAPEEGAEEAEADDGGGGRDVAMQTTTGAESFPSSSSYNRNDDDPDADAAAAGAPTPTPTPLMVLLVATKCY